MAGEPRGPMSFPQYRRVFFARAVSSAGSYMQIVAATWLAYALTGSATAVGVLSALALGPAIVGGPIGGALMDRYDPRRLAIVLSVCQAVPAALLAALAFAGDLSIAELYVLTFAGAVPFSLNQPVVTLIAPATVPSEFRQSAVARASMVYNITRLLGAVVGGVVVQAVGVGVAFAANALSYLAVALVLSFTHLVSDIQRRRGASLNVLSGVREGWGQHVLRLVGVGVAVFFTLVAPVEQLMPTVAQEHGMSPSAVGILVGAIGLGALLANPVIGKRNNSPLLRRRLMAIGLLLAAAGMVLLAVTPRHGIVIDVVGAALIGFGWEFVFVVGQSTVAVEVSPTIRGRVMGVFFVLVTATTALGALLIGLLMSWWGIVATFLLLAGVVAAVAVILLIRSRRTAIVDRQPAPAS